MRLIEYIAAAFANKNGLPYQFKNTRTLQMALGCWFIGKNPILIFPNFVQEFEGSLEMLIPIICVAIFVSIPLTFYTLGISQYSKKGWYKLWDAVPAWRGIGIAGIICLFISSLYSAFYCTYFLYYTVRSFDAETPWLHCADQDFKKEGCYTFKDNRSIRLDCINMYSEEHCSKIVWKNSALYFLDNSLKLKQRGSGFHFNTELIPYKIGVTIMMYILLRNSSASLSIFAPFLLIFPTCLHGALLIRSLLHPGALRALEFLCHFKWYNFLNLKFWCEIGTVSLYSTGFAYGCLSNFGMQYDFRYPINIDAVFINLASVTYSILYTLCIYNMCGVISYELNVPIDAIIGVDRHNANFIQAPLSFKHFSLTKFWTFLFFFSNFLLTLRILATQSEMLLSALYELKPTLKIYTIPCALVFSLTHTLLELITNFREGRHLIARLEELITYYIFPVLAFYLYIFIEFFYGVTHFVDDMHFMLGFRPSTIWKLSWYLGSLITFALIIYCWYLFEYEGPMVSYYFYTILSVFICLLPMLYFIMFVLIKRKKKVPWSEIFKSAKDWGPRDEVLRKSRDMFSAHDMTKEYLYRQQRLKFKTTTTSTSKVNASLSVNI